MAINRFSNSINGVAAANAAWFFSVTSRDWKHSRKQYSKTLDIAGLIAIPLKSLHVIALERVSLGLGIGTI